MKVLESGKIHFKKKTRNYDLEKFEKNYEINGIMQLFIPTQSFVLEKYGSSFTTNSFEY